MWISRPCSGQQYAASWSLAVTRIGNESVPIQLAQCRLRGLAVSNAKILTYFSYKMYGSSFIKQHSSKTVTV